MIKFIRIFLVLLVLGNLFLAAWYVLHQDIYFYADIGRDFLLFGEIAQKKLVLIGPRTSTAGLFHGPLWLYLNYPAYLLGQGNPLFVGWYWILIIAGGLLLNFWVAKKIFNNFVAYLYVLLLSIYIVFDAKSLIHPDGALLLLPFFFFLFVKYVETLKFRFLAGHFFVLGLLAHLEMAPGLPLIFLSSLAAFYIICRRGKFSHLAAFLFLAVSLSNFIIFDLRHDFLQVKSIIRNLSPSSGDPKFTYGSIILERVKNITHLQLVRNGQDLSNLLSFLVFFGLIFWQIKNNKYKTVYVCFLYFYLGFFAISLSQKHIILSHQFLPFFGLIFLIFTSLATSKYGKIFLIFFFYVYLSNFNYTLSYLGQSQNFFGKDKNSWNFLLNMSRKVYESGDKEFGYFVYSPDVFAYEPRYAM
ncbi:MAG: hypothetical protein Q8P25_00585, partial [Candidatus Curtissbacteria bacterium]|nr:hypothetical protein [Candidatus Curtissbacteria bacterium]